MPIETRLSPMAGELCLLFSLLKAEGIMNYRSFSLWHDRRVSQLLIHRVGCRIDEEGVFDRKAFASWA